MTEEEWLACADPKPMLEFLQNKSSTRKMRLHGCQSCRRIWHMLTDERSRKAIEKVEQYAESRISKDELSAAQAEADRAIGPWANMRGQVGLGPNWKMRAATTAAKLVARPSDFPQKLTKAIIEAARYALVGEFGQRNAYDLGQTYQCNLIHDIFGNPFRPISINPTWLTPTVNNLATIVYEERALPSGELDTARLVILADALEDAGCDNQEILGHLRSSGPHVRGCHVLDLLLGKE